MEKAPIQRQNQYAANDRGRGFTIPEVIIAGSIMIILCVGTMTAYVQAIKINRGNNLRMQALAVLQLEVEHYRSLKFVPGLETSGDLNNHRPAEIRVGTYSRPNRTSADGRVFTILATVTNLSFTAAGTAEEHVLFKEITIRADPLVAENEGWLLNLNTQVTVQRVRSN
jgi:type II secretory pathway pseudopilin PulG